MTISNDVKDALKAKKLVIGSRSVAKGMKQGTISSVILSSNAPDALRRDMQHYSSLSGSEVKDFSGTSVQLGQICGKPFNILSLGIRK